MVVRFIPDMGLRPKIFKLVIALQKSQDFIDKVEFERTRLGIPKNSFEGDTVSAAAFRKKNKKALSISASNLLGDKMPKNWRPEFENLLLIGSAIIGSEEISIVKNVKQKSVSIVLSNKITKNILDGWLKDNFQQIKKLFNELDMESVKGIGRQDMQILTHAKVMRDKGIPYKEVLSALEHSYGQGDSPSELIHDEEALKDRLSKLNKDLQEVIP